MTRAPGPYQTARALTPEQIRTAAQIAAQEGVTITIEAGNRVYRIRPAPQDDPQDLALDLRSMKR